MRICSYAARNVKGIDVRDVDGMDPVSLISYEKVLITVPALKKLEGVGMNQERIFYRITRAAHHREGVHSGRSC